MTAIAMVMRMAATESGEDLRLGGLGTSDDAGPPLGPKTIGPSELVSAGAVAATTGGGAGRAAAPGGGGGSEVEVEVDGEGADATGPSTGVSDGMRPAAIAIDAALGRSSDAALR